jgi:hypothetical protein
MPDQLVWHFRCRVWSLRKVVENRHILDLGSGLLGVERAPGFVTSLSPRVCAPLVFSTMVAASLVDEVVSTVESLCREARAVA